MSDQDRELVAAAMMQCSLATGHGDTIEDLLGEMVAQVRELRDRLRFDLDKLTGSVIDAYTLAPNDEEAKCEAVRDTLGRLLGRHPA